VIRPLLFASLLPLVLLAPPAAAQSSLGGQNAAPPRPPAAPAPSQPARPAQPQAAKPPQSGAAPAAPRARQLGVAGQARPPTAAAPPPRAAAAPAVPARPNAPAAASPPRAGSGGHASGTPPTAQKQQQRRRRAAAAAAGGAAAAGAATAAVVRPPEPEPPPTPAAPPKPQVGTVTGLPLPRFAALGSNQVNLRIGPDLRYRIDWTYQRRDLPVQIIEEHQIWRKIRDPEGTEGWVQRPLLNARRTFLVQGEERALRRRPEPDATPVAHLKPGVIGLLRRCAAGSAWCEVRVADHEGWLRRSDIWGVGADEAIE
jgi:SH3-like domain-containing protein